MQPPMWPWRSARRWRTPRRRRPRNGPRIGPRIGPHGAANRPAHRAGLITFGLAARILVARFAAAVPLLVGIGWALPIVVGAVYKELTNPSETATTLALRVLRDVPEVLVVVLLAGLVTEMVGSLAVRWIVLDDVGPGAASVRAVRHLLARPVSTLATLFVVLAGSLVIIVPGLVLAGLAWTEAGHALVGRAGAGPIVGLTLAFVVVWLGGVALSGAAGSWRSVAWTIEVLRARPGQP